MDTIKWIYNGEVSRIHHVHYPTQYSNGSKNWDGAPPPPELVLINTTYIPLHSLMV